LVKFDKNKLWILIASFILSVGLFYYISGEESVEIENRVFLKIIPPKGMTILGGPRRIVKVSLSAPRNILALLGTHKLIATHVISGVKKAGEYSFSLREGDINLPRPDIKVVDIMPRLITISLDEVISKKLLVKANIVGEPAEGYVVDENNILKDPTAALVKGPQSRLDGKKFILTDSIDVVGHIRSFRIRVPLKYSSQYTVVSKELIDVFVPIRQEEFKKVIKDIPVNILNAPSNNYFVTVDPPLTELFLKGSEKVLNKLDKKGILAYIDVTELSRGEYQLPLMLSLPSEISLSGDIPIIKVVIEEAIEELPVVPAIPPEIAKKEEGK